MDVQFTDYTRLAFQLQDSDGYLINEDGDRAGPIWHARKFDLSAYAGKTILKISLVLDGCTEPGPWSIWFADIA
jgi:hypothetical protein